MTSQEQVKRDKIKLPAPGVIFVKMLKKNKTVPCLVIRVGKVNSTVEIKGVETKVPNEDVDIDDQEEIFEHECPICGDDTSEKFIEHEGLRFCSNSHIQMYNAREHFTPGNPVVK